MRRPMSSVLGAVGEAAAVVGLLAPPESLEQAAADATVAPTAMIDTNLIHLTQSSDTQFRKVEAVPR